jgi:uncharacterized lipoprotein YmbA
VARSARAALAALALAVPLTGCTSTQHKAQRVQLDSARQRAALESTRVTTASPTVTPSTVGLVRGANGTAIVVTVHNGGTKPVTDLPISVGYKTTAGPKVYLNSAANLQYFQSHLPAIAAKGSLIWVYSTAKRLPNRVRPFATVGRKPSPPALLTETDVTIAVRYAHAIGSSAVTVHLDNTSSVPQYQLQVYAYARRAGRYVIAGNTTVPELDGGSQQVVRLKLVSAAPSANLRVAAIPTILQ